MVTYRVRVRSRGQITLPAAVREELGVSTGDLMVLRERDGDYVLSKAESWVERTRGALVSDQPPIEPEQLEDLIDAAAEAEDRFPGVERVEPE